MPEIHARSRVNGSWLDVHDVAYREFLVHLGLGLDQLMRTRSGGRQWVDGSPENLLVGEQLLAMFPQAQFIQVVREPVAVCMSMLASGFSEPWASDLDAAIRTWRHYIEVGLGLRQAFPDRVIQVKHSDMVRDNRAVAKKIARQLCLDQWEAISGFLATTRVNSSFDRQSYVEGSPFQPVGERTIGRTNFLSEYGAVIEAATADLVLAVETNDLGQALS